MEVPNMMSVDLTREFSSILFGLNAALVVSAVVIISDTAAGTWLRSLWPIERHCMPWHRPMLAR
jgi:hypothetical protein